MTEALKQWVATQEAKEDPDDWGMAHALSLRTARFWVQAFCNDVEKVAVDWPILSPGPGQKQGLAFDAIKHKLLGD